MYYNLTHFDADGIVAHIVLSNLVKEPRLFTTVYGSRLDTCLDGMFELAERECPTGIIVTDISFSPEQFTRMQESGIPFALFDHHQNSMQFKGLAKGNISEEKCGASLIFDFYNERLKPSKNYENLKLLVDLTDDYDMWHLKDKRSYGLSNLLFWRYKPKKFFRKFSNGFTEFDKEDHKIILEEIQKKRDIIASGSLVYQGEKDFICLIHQEASSLASDFRFYVKGYKIYCTFSLKNHALSIRYAGDEDINIPVILNPWIHEYDNYIDSFGGHPKASSINFSKTILHADSTFSEILEKIYQSFKVVV